MIKLNTNKDKVYKAIIKQILPAFDETSRSFIIKAYFDEKNRFRYYGYAIGSEYSHWNKKERTGYSSSLFELWQ